MTQQPQLTVREVTRIAQPSVWPVTAILFCVGLWLGGISLSWEWLIGILYFTIPFNFMAQGIVGGVKQHINAVEFWAITLAGSIPFWLCLWLLGNKLSALWLCAIILIAALYDFLNRRVSSLPGIDVIIAALLLTAPLTFGAYMSNTPVMAWVPAAIVLGMWAAAGYLLRNTAQATAKSTTAVLGPEKTYMTVLALYIAAAILPVIFYGWYAVPVAVLMTWDIWFCVLLLPFRTRPDAPAFGRIMRNMMRVNRFSAAIALVYLFLLQM